MGERGCAEHAVGRGDREDRPQGVQLCDELRVGPDDTPGGPVEPEVQSRRNGPEPIVGLPASMASRVSQTACGRIGTHENTESGDAIGARNSIVRCPGPWTLASRNGSTHGPIHPENARFAQT